MKKNAKVKKPFWEMTAEELDDATKKYERPIPLSKTKPLTKPQREMWNRMRKGPSASLFVLRGPDETIVKLDPRVRARSMRYATKHHLTLSELVNRSLKGLLAASD